MNIVENGYKDFWNIELYKKILRLNGFGFLYSLKRFKTILIQFREDSFCDVHNLLSRDIRVLSTYSRGVFALEYMRYYLLTKVRA